MTHLTAAERLTQHKRQRQSLLLLRATFYELFLLLRELCQQQFFQTVYNSLFEMSFF
jgi:hypothetical protein